MEPIVTGLYWRKSLWNGFASVPVILRLDGDLLTLKTTKNTVFQVQISETRCRFSVFGTMIVTVNGEDYAFVTAGAAVSKSFSKEQLAELSGSKARDVTNADAAVRVGTAVTTLGAAGAVGAPLAAAAYAASTTENISTWTNVFQSRHLLAETDP